MFNADDFLLTCEKCGNSFFSQSEKKFYQSKNFKLPKKCKTCREIEKKEQQEYTKNNLFPIYDEIINNWNIEASRENPAYFYNIEELNAILNGSKTFVTGRKGSGKTAIAQHIYELEHEDIFCQKLSFKEFPFNILYSLQNTQEYTAPNQYISIWKYLIYSYICKKMTINNNIDFDIQEKLKKLYGDTSTKSLQQMIKKWTGTEFGAEVLGVGFNFSRERADTDFNWIQICDILENIIKEYCDSSKYYIVFDELDEDYKDFSSSAEEKQYKCMLTSLFKASANIRNTFENTGINIYPVIFLRSDIYDVLTDSDKNKWNVTRINLVWDTQKIQKMIGHRLSVAFNIEDTDFQNVWSKLFSDKLVCMGNRGQKKMTNYEYIERSTEMRPRDFIFYIQECVKAAKDRIEHPIMPQTIKDADENFSEYLKQETIDELFAKIPEISEILGLLSTIRKQRISNETFVSAYESLVSQNDIPKRDVKWILLQLFDAGVIGNQPSMRGKAIFSFSQKSPRFNFNETMIVHRGLYKALQIF